jgi:radical SAM protein with 4Fe4S-binding SPASM domain
MRTWVKRCSKGANADLILKVKDLLMGFRGIRAYHPSLRTTRLPGPVCVQVQTIDRCNASCIMCPYSQRAAFGPANRMNKDLYRRLLAQLAAAGTTRVFSPMLQNEPLLDRDIARRIQEAREVLGKSVYITVVTNGALLSNDRVNCLLASGLDSISVSIDAFREDTYRIIRRGLEFSQVLENLHNLLRWEDRPQVIARFLKQRANDGEECPFVAYWRARGAGVFVHTLANRAGALDAYEGLVRDRTPSMRRLIYRFLSRIFPFCTQPFFALNVLWDGRVLLCCHDWGAGVIAGDLREQTLSEIWNGEKMNAYRHLLYTGSSLEIPPCRNCSHSRGPWGSVR